MKYYAFLEEIEDSGGELTLVFDSILHESVYKGKLNPNLQLIQTFQIIFSVNAKLLKSIYNRRNFLLDRWYEIEMSKRNNGVKATRYNLSNDQKLEISIDSIKILDRRIEFKKN
ncbi:hypothetical protein [Vibrio tasmaniensis]|uniref:hypothetical protein n=1 Tax=Vibrio tasmaniensis TaxID=212663 RepID=UPI0010805CA9|nr:hypothetical protein [Vibrio tasmaniensis]